MLSLLLSRPICSPTHLVASESLELNVNVRILIWVLPEAEAGTWPWVWVITFERLSEKTGVGVWRELRLGERNGCIRPIGAWFPQDLWEAVGHLALMFEDCGCPQYVAPPASRMLDKALGQNSDHRRGSFGGLLIVRSECVAPKLWLKPGQRSVTWARGMAAGETC